MKSKVLTAVLMCTGLCQLANASDARSYSAMPSDTELTELRIAHSTTRMPVGAIDVKTENDTFLIKHTHYTEFLGSLAALQLTVPYTSLTQTTNKVVKANNFNDATLLAAWGFYNNPALIGSEFKNRDKNGLSAAVAVSMTVPTGEYDATNALNVGSNRYTQKIELQSAWQADRLMLEGLINVTHFNKNHEYRGVNTLSQKNLYQFETHVSYMVMPTLWMSIDNIWAYGADVAINDVYQNKPQRSFSGGISAGYRFAPKQFIKVIYQNTLSKSDSSMSLEGVALSYNYLW